MLQARRRAADEAPGAIRVGYTCSKKVGNAVARNRAKRRLRAAARAILPEHGVPGWDYVLIGRPEATAARPFASLCDDLASALAAIHAPRTDRMSAPRLVVFDVDGTLVDSQHVILDAMATAFAALGAADAGARGGARRRRPVAATRRWPRWRRTCPRPTRCASPTHYRDRFVAQRAAGGAEAHAPLYPGALAALERLAAQPGDAARRRHRQGPARPRPRASPPTTSARFFVTAQTADHHPSKPHPSMLLAALAETGCDAAAAVMVGDTEFDMAMGRAAGFATVGVSWGYHPRERLVAAGADVVIDDFAALDAALARLGAGA